MAKWGFYGRDAELVRLRRRLGLNEGRTEPREFAAFGITGRRGVGKNTVLEETVERYGDPNRLLTVELPSTDRTPARFLRILHDAIDVSGFGPMLDDLPAPRPNCDDEYRLTEILEHLMYKDLIVCIDEVHNIRDTNVPSALKHMIDRLRRQRDGVLRATGKPPPPPGLLAT